MKNDQMINIELYFRMLDKVYQNILERRGYTKHPDPYKPAIELYSDGSGYAYIRTYYPGCDEENDFSCEWDTFDDMGVAIQKAVNLYFKNGSA